MTHTDIVRNADKLWIGVIQNDGGESMSKPIIRHCQNCKYGESLNKYSIVFCNIKYEYIPGSTKQRRKALFCRFFTPKTC